MIDNSLVFKYAGTIPSYFFKIWPVMILAAGIGWRRQFLAGMSFCWAFLFGIWVWTLFGTTRLPSVLLPEPWSTILFLITGVFLFALPRGVNYTRKLKTATISVFRLSIVAVVSMAGLPISHAESTTTSINNRAVSPATAGITISVPIRSDNLDAFEDVPPKPIINISGDANKNDWVGLDKRVMTGWVFANVTLPKDAVIQNSYIQYYGFGTSNSATTIRIKGFAEDNAGGFLADGTNRPSLRPTTSSFIDWSGTWPYQWNWYRSPDLTDIIKDIIHRPGWSSGHSLGFQISNPSGTGTYWAVPDYASGALGNGGNHSVTLIITYQSVATVPLFYQGRPSTPSSILSGLPPDQYPNWQDFTYGSRTVNPDTNHYDTIGRWGCNTASTAMILDYFANNSVTDPGKLNQWLRDNNGYQVTSDLSSLVNYKHQSTCSSGSKQTQKCGVEDYASSMGIPLSINPGSNNNSEIDQSLLNGYPVLLQVPVGKGTHWVVATGKTTDQSSYLVNDPILGRTTLSAHYSNHTAAVYFSGNRPSGYIQAGVHSPLHLLVTDPQGRKEGYDPRDGSSWDQIPGSAYIVDAIADPDGNVLPETKLLYIANPVSGDYSFELIGDGTGSYEVDIDKTTPAGEVVSQTQSGTTQPSMVNNLTIKYVAPLMVYLPLMHR